MKKKHAVLYCNLCGGKVQNTGFQAQWRHLARFHPLNLIFALARAMEDPDRLVQVGRDFAERMTR